MKIFMCGRREGKTTEAIKLASQKNYCMVCKGRVQAEEVFQQAKKMKCKISFPLTFDELLNGAFRGTKISGFVIDNADFLLQYFCRSIPLEGITLTKE